MDTKHDILVDVRGEFCPVPVIRTSDAIRQLPVGGTVLVIADDPAIAIDLPAWCHSNGHEGERVSRDGNEYRYLVRKCSG
jgi:TusA-related sulfurtransferase